MTVKWSKKMAAEYAEQLRSPFEDIVTGQNTAEEQTMLPDMAEKIKDTIERNKGVEPE